MRGLPRTSLILLFALGVYPSPSLSFEISGQVTDVRTNAGIEGLPVQIGTAVDTTGSDGRFRVEFSGSARFVVDGTPHGFCAYLAEPFAVTADTNLRIGLVPLDPLRSGYYRNMLHFLRLLTGTGEPGRRAMEDVSVSYESSPRTTLLRHWEELPIRIHLPSRRAAGFSWDRVVRRAIDRWESKAGLDLFEPVTIPDNAQVQVLFEGQHSRVIFEEATLRGAPRKARMWLDLDLVDPADLQASAEHELGHILMILVHSEDPEHIMYWGGSHGRAVTDDEALLVRCLYGLPNFSEMDVYIEEVPPTREMVERKRVLAVVTIQILVAIFVILSAH